MDVLMETPAPNWVACSFVAWADSPTACVACGHARSNPRMLVREISGEKQSLVVSYAPDPNNTIEWRLGATGPT